MGEKRGFSILLCIFLVVFIVASPVVLAVDKDNVVVVNSKDWKDRYLATIYAGLKGFDIMHFDTLADAQLQTSLLENKNEIIVLESESQAVVKKYSSYLDVNAIKGYDIILFDGYDELQNELWDEFDTKGYIVLDTQFGVEAITSAPLVYLYNFTPYFLDSENKNDIKSLIRKKDSSEIIIAGHFPIRLIQDLDGKRVTATTEENGHLLTKLAYDTGQFDWGLITRIDEVDLSTLNQKLPIFLYTGDVERIANSVKESDISNFEVIDASMADIARGVRTSSGRNIGLMLKYARTFANVEGMGGKVLTLDTVRFDFPYPNLKLLETNFYPSMNVVALKFHNDGNVPVSFFSSVEFAGTSTIDEEIHRINVGDTVTIPYEFENPGNDQSRATITTQFGVTIPLNNDLLSSDGTPIIYQDVVEKSGTDTSQLNIIKAEYNDRLGSFYVTIENPHDYPLEVRSEVIINSSSVLASSPTVAEPGETVIKIPTPYLLAKDITFAPRDFIMYYGREDTLLVTSQILTVEEINSGFLTGAFVAVLGAGSGNIAFFVIIIILVALIVIRRQTKKKRQQRNQGNGNGGMGGQGMQQTGFVASSQQGEHHQSHHQHQDHHQGHSHEQQPHQHNGHHHQGQQHDHHQGQDHHQNQHQNQHQEFDHNSHYGNK